METTSKKEQVRQTFDGAAATYLAGKGSCFNHFGALLVQQANLHQGVTILDVATGQGAVLLPAARQVGPSGRAVGIDLSPKMLEKNAEFLSKEQLSWAETHLMDAEHLDFPDNTFDAVFCAFGLFFFPSPTTALKEMQRVLKPNGTLAVSTWGPKPFLSQWVGNQMKEMGAKENIRSSDLRNEQQLRDLLTSAGLSNIDITTHTKAFPFGPPEQWIQLLWSSGARALVEQLSTENQEILREKAIAKAQDFVTNGEVSEELKAIFAFCKPPK